MVLLLLFVVYYLSDAKKLFTFVDFFSHIIEARILDVQHQAISREVDLVL